MAPRFAPVLLAVLLASAPRTQTRAGQSQGGRQDEPQGTTVVEFHADVVASIPGTVKDLARDSMGRVLYCSAEGRVGRITPGLGSELLADAGSGPFPNELRALAETPGGDIAVLDVQGNVRVLFGAHTPAVLRYSDLYMIGDATDLVVDARGSYLIASATPSSGQRAVNWVQDDGQKWGYYLVKHQPAQLAHDPLTGGLLIAETSGGGNLQLVAASNPYRPTSPVDTSTHPGMTVVQDDGDMALEANGDIYWIAAGKVYKRTRASGTTALFASGYAQLRGITIAPSSVLQGSAWSLYLAEGSNPTRVREIPGVGAPAALIANDQGAVPGRGLKVNVNFGFQAYELCADNSGRLLLGGSNFGATHYVKRVTLTGTPSIATVATSANGLAGHVEGLCVAPDNSIYALTRPGVIHHITEGPLAVTTVFSDPANQITAGKDMTLDVNGDLYVACRESWDFGKVLKVSGGAASLLTLTEETRGLAANPAGGMFVSQWHNTGFHGTVDLLHFSGNTLEAQPGFIGMNYTNDFVWGDGDICVDANGSIYTISEDDWALIRYDPAQDAFVRFGSGYLNHPSGLAIAPSTAGSGSSTGWSLYVSEFDNLWEKPSVPAPASTLVDASLGRIGAAVAGSVAPRHGRPLALATGAPGGGILIGTQGGHVLALDPWSGDVRPLAGPDEGLRGEIVALAGNGTRVRALNARGEAFEIVAGSVRALACGSPPELLERALAHPLRRVSLRDSEGFRRWFVLDGWSVWRAGGG